MTQVALKIVPEPIVREAKREDIPIIRDLIVEVAEELNIVEQSGLEIDSPTILTVVRHHMATRDALVLVHEEDGIIDSFFVGTFFPYYLDIRKMLAHEKISGGPNKEKLWDRFMEWAEGHNISGFVRGCYDSTEGSRFRRRE